MRIQIDGGAPALPFPVEWRWTGFTPGRLLLDPAMERQLDWIAAMPANAIRFVRPHWLLDLVDILQADPHGQVFDFTRLDTALDRLVRRGFRLCFELMGRPEGFTFNDFLSPEQASLWEELIAALATHLVSRHGRQTVSSWYFETWNEPDEAVWWTQSPKAFSACLEACRRGLARENLQDLLGGPGTCHTLSTLLRHVVEQHAGQLHFLSVHEKGAWSSREDIPLSPERMVEHIRRLRHHLRNCAPALLQLPLMNNEADPQVGWSDPHTWRALPFYPAWIMKMIALHTTILVDQEGVSRLFLGSDHGFLGDWGQRGLLTCFRHPDTGGNDFVKKPVWHLFSLLAFMGNLRCPCQVHGARDLHVLATRLEDRGFMIVCTRVDNRPRVAGPDAPVEVCLEGLPPGDWLLIEHALDERHANPYRTWEDMLPDGPLSNWIPDDADLQTLREAQELNRPILRTWKLSAAVNTITFRAKLPLPGVRCWRILRRESCPPPQSVRNARVLSRMSLHATPLRELLWQPDPSPAVLDYHLEWRTDANTPWTEIQHPPLLDGILLHPEGGSHAGAEYRIRAVDAWARESPDWTGFPAPL